MWHSTSTKDHLAEGKGPVEPSPGMGCLTTNGVYHPDEERIGPGTICMDGRKIVGLSAEPPSDIDDVSAFGGYGFPGLVDAHSHGLIRPDEGDQLGQIRQDSAT